MPGKPKAAPRPPPGFRPPPGLAPPARRRRNRRPRRGRRQGRPFGTVTYDPRVKIPVPSEFACGRALPGYGCLNTYVKTSQLTATTELGWQIVLLGPIASTSLVGLHIYSTDADPPVFTVDPLYIPQYAIASGLGGPASGRVMKLGVEIANETAPLFTEGVVYVKHFDQRLTVNPTAWTTQAQADAWANTVAALPSTKMYPAYELLSKKSTHFCVPTDITAYNEFRDWTGNATTASGWAQHYTTSATSPRPMDCIALLFPTGSPAGLGVAGAGNKFRLKLLAEWYFRYGYNDNRHEMMYSVPTAPASVMNSVHARTQKHFEEHPAPGFVSHMLHDAGRFAKRVAEPALEAGATALGSRLATALATYGAPAAMISV